MNYVFKLCVCMYLYTYRIDNVCLITKKKCLFLMPKSVNTHQGINSLL